MTFSGSEVMPSTIVQLLPKPQTSECRSNTMCAVVERPDHHCGDDLVNLLIGHSSMCVHFWCICFRTSNFFRLKEITKYYSDTGSDAGETRVNPRANGVDTFASRQHYTTSLNLETRGEKEKKMTEEHLAPRSRSRRQRNWLHLETVGEIDSGQECLA